MIGSKKNTGPALAAVKLKRELDAAHRRMGPAPKSKLELDFSKQPCMAAMIECVGEGLAREVMAVGPRGDGKTIGALAAMLYHAKRHEEHGYALPVTWMGVMDTFRSHELKTHSSAQEGLWQGAWTLSGDGRVMRGWADGRRRLMVEVHLFGVEDQGAMDKMRMAAHCLWVDEAAPTAVLVQSSGISETAWLVGLTSLRSPTHANVALLTENYPDEDHWTWIRFAVQESPQRRLYRIPPGERASATQRAAWAEALKDRPDLLKRLLAGQPGGVMLGPQVAQGFDQDRHVAKERLRAQRGEPIILGQDFGHTPASVIGQVWRGEIRILAALACERGGIKQHVEGALRPWLAQWAPWVLQNPDLLIGVYDQAGETGEQTDIEENPFGTLEAMLPGRWTPGPMSWDARKNALLSVMNQHVGPGRCALQIDPVDGRPLIQALNGRWYYAQKAGTGQLVRDTPKKPNHPWEDLGDGLCYFLHGLGSVAMSRAPVKVESEFALTLGSGASFGRAGRA